MKILLLTGSDVIDNTASDMSPSTTGIDGFVQKPIGITKLTDKILGLLDETKDRTFLRTRIIVSSFSISHFHSSVVILLILGTPKKAIKNLL